MEVIRNALKKNNGNMSTAAQALKVSRMTLYRLIQKYELDFEAR
jgi:transcriptional regulator with PAS, ATPase and Fis domain